MSSNALPDSKLVSIVTQARPNAPTTFRNLHCDRCTAVARDASLVPRGLPYNATYLVEDAVTAVRYIRAHAPRRPYAVPVLRVADTIARGLCIHARRSASRLRI